MIDQALALINNYICTNQIDKVAEPLAMAKKLQPEHVAYEFFDRNEPCEFFGKNWRWENLNGKSLEIFCDHGMGDTIMMLRYIKRLKESFDVKIILNSLVYEPFQRLMDSLDFIDVFTKNHEGCDFHTNIMQLPWMYHEKYTWESLEVGKLNSMGKKLIPDQPLLKTDKTAKIVFKEDHFGQLKFGLKFGSSPLSSLFDKKSIDLKKFHSFQPFVSLELIEGLGTQWLQYADRGDIFGLMSVMENLPTIVSVDTMTLHLAGSMGLKTIGLLCHDHDPRWGKKETTHWYPSMTLLRQEKAGEWGKVLRSLKKLLTK